jgi:type I restriction enzyme R subunit
VYAYNQESFGPNAPLYSWTEKEQTQAEVESFILDQVYLSLPEPPIRHKTKRM